MLFKDLNIIDPILKALIDENYTEPTLIQEKAIPVILDGKDVLGSAQTGTGKTAAFAIPILQHLYNRRRDHNRSQNIKTLIITPTRELAIQIGESFSTYGKFTGIRNTVIFGGVKQASQTNALRHGVDVLIATPGRLLDLMDQGYVRLNDIEYFVLDEADRMLDMGFIHDIRKIIAKLPHKRQSLFFSATMPGNIVELSRKILQNPVKIEATPSATTAETVQQYLYYTNKSTKKDLLEYILNDQQISQVLLFSKTKHGADKITRNLKQKNIKAAAIHGDKGQNQRQKVLQQFKNGEIRVLVATDIAARGIDIDKLKYVINYDIPNISETYVHRIGRAGRAGEEGISISICEPEEIGYVKEIEKLINQKIELVSENPFPQTEKPMTKNEKAEWEKEKIKRKKEFFANRNNNSVHTKSFSYSRNGK
ncbi:MAG TPA: DEAD/DEAH box helicase [Draconibacterium sp.]|nr:DEAD/DEAH box helicase [Draconibacterium sp.]